MEATVLTAGLVCFIAAIAGGGLEAFGIKVPLISSRPRQVVLGGFGLSLVLVAVLTNAPFNRDASAPRRGSNARGPSPSVSGLPPTPSAALFNSPPVQQERFVSLWPSPGRNAVDIEYWRSGGDGIGDLQMDQGGIFTVKGAMLVVVEDSSQITYARCSRVKDWQERVKFSVLHVGSQLCARSKHGRFAMLQVRDLPDESDSEFIFYGRVWELEG